MDSSLVIAGKCNLTKTTLEIPEGIAFEEWEGVGKALKLVANVFLWGVCDWLNYGEFTYGDKYHQAADAVGLAAHTLHNVQSAGSRFSPERRREGLSFEHHRLVAYLSPKEQDMWLNKCEEEKLTAKQLREAMNPKPQKNPDPYYRLTLEWEKHPGEHVKEQITEIALKTGGTMKNEKEFP